jgi:hypothetical protein
LKGTRSGFGLDLVLRLHFDRLAERDLADFVRTIVRRTLKSRQ